MPTLEELRKKKYEQLIRSQQDKNAEGSNEELIKQQIEQMELVVRNFLSKEALQRYGSLKTAHKEKSLQLLVLLFQAIQKGQIKSEIDDSTLKKVLEQLTPKQREIKIKRV